MYNPKAFREERIDVLHETMRTLGAATFVSQGPDGLLATHAPIELDPLPAPYGTLKCHMARANPHWKSLAEGGDLLAIFQGPQRYISPNWYPSKHETGRAVPTWNYVAIHAQGRARVHQDAEWLLRHLRALTAHHEADQAVPWSPDDAPADFLETQCKAIVGIEIGLTGIDGKWKVSQNRTEADRLGVVAGLRGRDDEASRTMHDLVASRLGGTE